MTAIEFKSWLDGFMEGRAGRLTAKDIKKIQAQAASVWSGCGCHPWRWSTYTTSPTVIPSVFPTTTGGTTVDSTDITWIASNDGTAFTSYQMPATTLTEPQ